MTVPPHSMGTSLLSYLIIPGFSQPKTDHRSLTAYCCLSLPGVPTLVSIAIIRPVPHRPSPAGAPRKPRGFSLMLMGALSWLFHLNSLFVISISFILIVWLIFYRHSTSFFWSRYGHYCNVLYVVVLLRLLFEALS